MSMTAKTDAPPGESAPDDARIGADRAPKRRGRKRSESAAPPAPNPPKPRTPERTRALLRAQLGDGPKPGAEVEIPKRELLAATDALGVRTQRGAAGGEGPKTCRGCGAPISHHSRTPVTRALSGRASDCKRRRDS
jgi:hypothetical protein